MAKPSANDPHASKRGKRARRREKRFIFENNNHVYWDHVPTPAYRRLPRLHRTANPINPDTASARVVGSGTVAGVGSGDGASHLEIVVVRSASDDSIRAIVV